MSNTHTPGPWEPKIKGTYVHVIAPTATKNQPHGQVVAQVCSGPGKNTIENAQLIAAAPELLHALELVAWEKEGFDDHISRVVRAAIAKARGEL